MNDKTKDLNDFESGTASLYTIKETQELSQIEESHNQKNDGKYRCLGCMELLDEKDELCPYCGYVKNTGVEQPIHILPGTIIKNKYMVGKVLGYGGFGVTYIGWDLTLQRKIAVKEYLPSEFSTRAYGQTKVTVFSGDRAQQFEDGKRKFVDEAKRLAKFQGESGIVNIFDSFEENETAYIVMEYLDGETLKEYLKREGKIPAEKATELLVPVLESLNKIHAAGIIHRDVSPDNIMITKDGRVKLIDFGAARYATTTASRSLTVIIKPGYSPEEQYRSRSDQGPYTDVYSLGAVLYKMITGETPPDALKRRAFYESKGKEILVPVHKLVKGVPKNIEYAIYNAMNPRIEDRTPDMVNFMGELFSDEPIKRKNGKIKKIDVLTWPLWAKILAPTLISIALILSILLGVGVIGPRSKLQLGVKIPEGKTLIPDVVTETLDKAKKKLKKSDLELLIGEKVEDERIKENLILAQSPEAGELTDIGTIIEIKISAGAPKEFVINVEGFTKELAQKELEDLGFKVEFKEKFNADVAPGAVISQSVKAGEELRKGDIIILTISKGDKDIDTTKPAKIPEVVGMDIEKAKELAKKVHLYIAIEKTEYSSTIPEGQIISQTPPKGFDGHQGDTIKVTVSLGIKTSYMPDVVYRTQEKAIEMLENLGLKVKVVEEENKEVAAGTVFKQSIKKGEEVKTGTTVTITVSKAVETEKESAAHEKNPDNAKPSTSKIVSNGKCGPNANYTLDSNGLLTISGTGAMYNYTFGEYAPWKSQSTSVKTVHINEGITSVGDYAFFDSFDLTKVELPTTLKSIGNFAFFASQMVGIKIPNSVTTIKDSAFSDCGKLKSIIIPNGVVTISSLIFRNCEKLTSVTIPSSVSKIEYEAFYNCSSLSNITIPNSVTTIEIAAFSNCSSLKSITIPNYITTIENVVFSGCSNLKSVTIPNGVTTINVGAFAECTSLTSITIPKSVEIIELDTFSNCSSLTNINVSPQNRDYCDIDGVLFTKDKEVLVLCPGGREGNYAIPSTVRSIFEEAFSDCKKLKSVTIPLSVEYVGHVSFFGWSANQTIYMQGRSSAPSTWDTQWNENCSAKIVWNA